MTDSTYVLPDGSAFMIGSMPLPKDHWLYAEGENIPPAHFRLGVGPERDAFAESVRDAARYALRASTMNGTAPDYDPDAVVQNMIVGMVGYWSKDGK